MQILMTLIRTIKMVRVMIDDAAATAIFNPGGRTIYWLPRQQTANHTSLLLLTFVG